MMHYYQFHIGDYHAHTAHLDELEDLAYRRMLDYCYLNECGLPETIEDIARVIRMRTHCERIATVLREFFYLADDGTYRSKRVEIEIDRVSEKSEKAAEAARLRWEKERKQKENADANALRTHCEGNAIQDPISNTQEPISNTKTLAVAKAPATRGTRLPDDWVLPKPWGEWAVEQGWRHEAIRLEADKFGDYWRAKAGRDACKRDWFATWKNWIRNAKKPTPLHSYQMTSFADTHTDKSWAEVL